MADRVCVFIDGANFDHQCKDSLGGRTDVNIGAFAAWLVGPARALVRTYHYRFLCPAIIRRINATGRTVSLGSYIERPTSRCASESSSVGGSSAPRAETGEKWMEKGVDMRVGIDMLALAGKDLYDTAVLVTGDGDFAEAVQAVKDLGNHVEVACSFEAGRMH